MPLYVFFELKQLERMSETKGNETDNHDHVARPMVHSATESRLFAPRTPETRGEKLVLVGILILTGITMIILAIYYFMNPRSVVGDAFVNTSTGAPLEVPPPGSFPLYIKPITVLFMCVVAFGYCFLCLIQRPLLMRLPKWFLSLCLVVTIVVLSMSAYEVLFNFALWSALITRATSPDLATNSFPVNSLQVNLVYATKSFVATLVVSFFAVQSFRTALDRATI
jgi:hypothetical protein